MTTEAHDNYPKVQGIQKQENYIEERHQEV